MQRIVSQPCASRGSSLAAAFFYVAICMEVSRLRPGISSVGGFDTQLLRVWFCRLMMTNNLQLNQGEVDWKVQGAYSIHHVC